MEKIEIAKILEWHNSGTLNTDEAIEKIFSLFSVVGQSEQLKCEHDMVLLGTKWVCKKKGCNHSFH